MNYTFDTQSKFLRDTGAGIVETIIPKGTVAQVVEVIHEYETAFGDTMQNLLITIDGYERQFSVYRKK